ncbi:carbon-nitrogen hydrolase family protein [Georgenia thermotolerans]|uniref:Hydrolase n=1 Tax=Georgenia thermotolerans TaxID=527326 RepID=A0A7J5ULE1_9MICO|nr:carbon-nitrogen hydrolase family protein [Georgenia thermotolerans]KAE8763100.1 hydrolase [Georgenia thermotolerans]
MQVAVAQMGATTDKAANLTAATDLIARAARAGARLVVLPEYAMAWDPRPTPEALAAEAEGLDGPFVAALARAAHAHGVTVVAGMTERHGDGPARPYNTVVAVNAGGELIGAYRKVHLYDAFGDRESDRLAPRPPEALVLALGDLRVGVMTCYDLRFPEMARFLVDAGANVLALPATWIAGPGKLDHWRTLAKARAIENTVYVLAAGQTGRYRTGHSLVVGPSGEVLAEAGEEPGVAVAEVSGAQVQAVRERNPSLANRRFEVRPADA